MKKIIFSAIYLLFLSSCVLNDTVVDEKDSTIKGWKQNMDVGSRSESNAFLWHRGEYIGHKTIDWNSPDYSINQKNVSFDKGMAIYAYDGKGGEYIVDNGMPAIYYKQTKENIYEDSFNYAVITEQDAETSFHPAFSNVKFQIKNNHKGLYLKINSVGLGNISRECIFHFPFDSISAEWTGIHHVDDIVIPIEEIGLEAGESYIFPEEQYLPFIPQSNKAWNTQYTHWSDKGSFIILDCIIYNVMDLEKGYQSEKDYTIWCGENETFAQVHIPLNLDFRMGENCIVEISLEENCPWYDASGTFPKKVLNPIIFDATVDDWTDGGDVNVEA